MDRHPRLIKNSQNRTCQRCSGVHEYLTRLSEDTDCNTPVAFSLEKANKVSLLLAGGLEDVVRVPDDTIIVMDDSARTLPRAGSGQTRLAQFSITERLA
jgi:hypothetical protein